MDSKVYIIVYSCLIHAVYVQCETLTDQYQGVQKPAGKDGGSADESKPPPKPFYGDIAEELEELQNLSAALQIKRFEHNISQAIVSPRFQDGEKFKAKTVDVTVHRINVSKFYGRSAAKSSLLHDHLALGRGQISLPEESIRNLQITQTRSSLAKTDLVMVVAEWRMREGLRSEDGLLLPQNGSLFSVSYFLSKGEKSELLRWPASYEVDLRDDFTEIYQLRPSELLKSVERKCMWLNLTSSQWESSGCTVTSDTPGKVRCECNHTTTFAVLLVVKKVEDIPFIVKTISYGFEAASVVALAVTIVFLLASRRQAGIDSTHAHSSRGMRSNRTNSQVSLCASLAGLHLLLLGGDAVEKSGSESACVAVAAFTHFFLLASAFWSFNEGLGIFIKTVPKLTLAIQFRQLTIIQLLFGWIIPLFVTLVCLIWGLGIDEYIVGQTLSRDIVSAKMQEQDSAVAGPSTKKFESCWLSAKISLGGLVPVVVVLFLNLLILLYITVVVIRIKRKVSVYQASSMGNNSEEPSAASGMSAIPLSMDAATKRRDFVQGIASGLRTFAILMPVLSVPWIFGLLCNIADVSVAFQSTHVLVNGLQGIFIFLLYCVFGRSDWERLKRKWKNSDIRYLAWRYRKKRNSVAIIRRQGTSYGTNASQGKVDVNQNVDVSL